MSAELDPTHALGTDEFAPLLSHLGERFRGAHAADYAGPPLERGQGIVFNIDKLVRDDGTAGSGTHWVSAVRGAKDVVYFDSFGAPPPASILAWLSEGGTRPVHGSETRLQDLRSNACGYYAADFVNEMLTGSRLATTSKLRAYVERLERLGPARADDFVAKRIANRQVGGRAPKTRSS